MVKAMKINWIDMVKITGTFSVILGHINSPLGGFIFSWHMPLFFICSGFLAKIDVDPFVEIKKNFNRLIMPYFIFSIIGLLSTIAKSYLLLRPIDYISELSGVFFWMDMPSLINSYAFVLWFLPALFFSKLWFLLINKYIKRIHMQLIIVAFLFLFGVNYQLPFAIDESFTALPWIICGYWLFKILNNDNDNQNLNFILFSGLIIISVYIFHGIPKLDMANKQYDDYYILNLLWAGAIVYLFCFAFRFININNGYIVRFLSCSAMLMYTLHPYTNNISYLVIEYSGFGGGWFLKFLLSCAILLPIMLIRNVYDKNRLFKYV